MERKADSDQLCEHLSHFLQAVGRFVGARLFSFFLSCLSSSDFPLFFVLSHLTVTAASSPDLSGSHLLQLFTFIHPPPPAEVLEGTWPTWCLAVDSSRGCKRGPVWLNGEDFQSRADVSYTGVHHTGSMCCHELFTLFFFGRECKCRDVRGGLNKIWVEEQEAVADSWGLEHHLRISLHSPNLLQQLQ